MQWHELKFNSRPFVACFLLLSLLALVSNKGRKRLKNTKKKCLFPKTWPGYSTTKTYWQSFLWAGGTVCFLLLPLQLNREWRPLRFIIMSYNVNMPLITGKSQVIRPLCKFPKEGPLSYVMSYFFLVISARTYSLKSLWYVNFPFRPCQPCVGYLGHFIHLLHHQPLNSWGAVTIFYVHQLSSGFWDVVFE